MKKFIVIAATFLLGWGSVELYRYLRAPTPKENELRIYFHPRYGISQGSSIKKTGLETNSEGFRDTMDFAEKIPLNCDRYRIMIMGSSVTFGLRIPFPETLGPKLERSLGKKNFPVSVFNFSIVGGSSFAALNILDDWLAKVRPSLVITGYGYIEATAWKNGFPHPANIEKLFHFFRPTPENKVADYLRAISLIREKTRNYGPLIVLPTVRGKDYATPTLFGTAIDEASATKIYALGQADFPGTIYPEQIREIRDPADYRSDQLHLSESGFEKLVNMLLPVIEKELARLPRPACQNNG